MIVTNCLLSFLWQIGPLIILACDFCDPHLLTSSKLESKLLKETNIRKRQMFYILVKTFDPGDSVLWSICLFQQLKSIWKNNFCLFGQIYFSIWKISFFILTHLFVNFEFLSSILTNSFFNLEVVRKMLVKTVDCSRKWVIVSWESPLILSDGRKETIL